MSLLGNAVLTYFGKWDFVEPLERPELATQLYVAPGESPGGVGVRETRVSLLSLSELQGLEEGSPAADWWSLGAILFEVLTGQVSLFQSLSRVHVTGNSMRPRLQLTGWSVMPTPPHLQTLLSCHPEGVHSHIPLRIPCSLSPEAVSLLKQVYSYSAHTKFQCRVEYWIAFVHVISDCSCYR